MNRSALTTAILAAAFLACAAPAPAFTMAEQAATMGTAGTLNRQGVNSYGGTKSSVKRKLAGGPKSSLDVASKGGGKHKGGRGGARGGGGGTRSGGGGSRGWSTGNGSWMAGGSGGAWASAGPWSSASRATKR